MASTAAAVPRPTAAASPMARKPPFKPICRYWLLGKCSRATTCSFSHSSPNRTSPATSSPPAPQSHPTAAAATTPNQPPKSAAPHPQINAAPSSSSSTTPSPPPPPPLNPAAAAAAATVVSWPTSAVAGIDGSLSLWNSESSEKWLMHMLPSPATTIVDAQHLHPGLLLLLLASGDLALWNAASGGGDGAGSLLVSIPPCFGKAICAVPARTRAAPNPLIFAGCDSGAILCWAVRSDGAAAEPCAMQHCHAAPLVCLATSSNDVDHGQLLYSASADGAIAVWDVDTFNCLQLLQPAGVAAPVTKLVAAGSYLFAGCADGSIKVWGTVDGRQMELLHTQALPRQPAAVVDICGPLPKGGSASLICAYSDGSISMWEVPSFMETAVMQAPFAINMMSVGRRGDGRSFLMLAGSEGSVTSLEIAL